MHIKKMLLEIQVIYLGNMNIYCIFKTCCTICFIIHKSTIIS